ncbi:SUMF1/EgtB/PvdOfamily nonheme iron enzyme [Vicingus serpentipes]|uniref:SUMF1/EgtB/PvdOfamily nonheme iron enzyme n=1 Tax=Vicingus serpentipes TaxID=1926625 RepID=A0A5C6RPK2_9FLAO|nr:SUMF1/EgtB/PvdO family nonheme iron enzyme [Vicingus serpentipes]TXB63909.1 SUMF1/EgtB/PvdOfamily nonheme iron enzyme [Vicingus serpentipes]
MKRILILLAVVVLYACSKGNGELIGVQGREEWYQPDPFGMLFIPMGSYNMGPSDQDVPYSLTAQTRTVSVQAFYMDQTEISNNEYRQFVYWVRDSMARRIMAEEVDEEAFSIAENDYGEEIDPPLLDWYTKLKWDEPEAREALEPMFYSPAERFYRRRELDARKLNYEYYWIDYRRAAKRESRDSEDHAFSMDRSKFIMRDVINVYPDTLAWIHDLTYSFNEPMTKNYFWHPAYDDYPVVGVSWKQATAFCIWRTQLLESFLIGNGSAIVNDFRLPTESEWEWAARGGLDLSPYPWGGPYIRNSRGCFLGNFKPMRGNYIDDGGFHTVKINSYNPNDFGLYCMAGNVAEWTSNAFDESAYNFAHDLNPDYMYDAKENDPPSLKRKVIRGGSWKDVGYYLQTSTRTYEYQDTAKCYIGFRCVMTYLGRAKDDNL